MSGFEVDLESGEHRGTDAACHIKSRFAKARSWDKAKDLETPEVDDDEWPFANMHLATRRGQRWR